MKDKSPTQVFKPELGTFKIKRGSPMPEMGPLIPEIGHLRHVYSPLRFKTLGWAISQTWREIAHRVTRIGLLHEFDPSGLKGLSHA